MKRCIESSTHDKMTGLIALATKIIDAGDEEPADIEQFSKDRAALEVILQEDRETTMVRKVLVHLMWDDPLKSAGYLIVKTNDTHQVFNLLKIVRERVALQKAFATGRLYDVIRNVFNEYNGPTMSRAGPFMEFEIIGVGEYETMEFQV